MVKSNCVHLSAVLAGFWSLLYSCGQLTIFGWQLNQVQERRSEAYNRKIPRFGYAVNSLKFPGHYGRFYETPEAKTLSALFIVVIVNLAVHGFLLVASASLVYGLRCKLRHFVWPWIPCVCVSILSTLAFCITSWVGDLDEALLGLTIVECVLAISLNGASFCAVVIAYRRLRDYGTAEGRMVTDPLPPPPPGEGPWDRDMFSIMAETRWKNTHPPPQQFGQQRTAFPYAANNSVT